MEQRKTIVISCLLYASVVIAVCGILYFAYAGDLPTSEPALTCEQLEISIDFPGGAAQIHVWKDSEEMLYFFLPSGADACEISFCNLGSGSRLRLDSEIFTSENSLIEEIEYSKVYEIELTYSDEAQTSEMCQVVFLKSEGLPSLFIDTASGSVENIHEDKSVKEEAFMYLVNEEGNECFSGVLEHIKTRGHTSWYFVKKPYQIKLAKEASLLGMPSAKRWILLANYLDTTLMKSEMIFRYAEKYSTVPTINGQYVDLYINHEYLGNYYLCEKIELGRNGLNITDLEEATENVNYDSSYANALPYVSDDGKIKATQGLNNPEDITGGYIIEHLIGEKWEVADNAFMTDSGELYAIVSPSPATVEQAEYICGLFNEMEAAIAQEDGINPLTGKHFSEYLDLDSWASKYVMEEVFHDADGISGISMFLYKDSDSVDPRIYSGPMWDYDRALGSCGHAFAYRVDSPMQVIKSGLYVEELMRFDEVSSLVYEKFEQVMIPYVENELKEDVYKLSQYLDSSAVMDFVRWPRVNGYYADRSASIDYLIYFLENKTDYLKNVWLKEDDYCTVTFLDYYGSPYKIYKVGDCETRCAHSQS